MDSRPSAHLEEGINDYPLFWMRGCFATAPHRHRGPLDRALITKPLLSSRGVYCPACPFVWGLVIVRIGLSSNDSTGVLEHIVESAAHFFAPISGC